MISEFLQQIGVTSCQILGHELIPQEGVEDLAISPHAKGVVAEFLADGEKAGLIEPVVNQPLLFTLVENGDLSLVNAVHESHGPSILNGQSLPNIQQIPDLSNENVGFVTEGDSRMRIIVLSSQI